MRILTIALFATAAFPLLAQSPPEPRAYTVVSGTKVPLQLISSISTKTSVVGDRVYLQTNFPILADGRIVIPPGAYVTGTVTFVKRAGKVKGRAELYIRFDSLTLPNGVTRDFRASLGGMDGSNPGSLDRTEGKVTGEGGKGSDARKVGEAAGWGTMAGGLATQSGMGAGIGAAAGAAAGLIGVLVTRGPDAIIERGSTVEMVLDRSLKFSDEELAGITPARGGQPGVIAPPARAGNNGNTRYP
jgi:hypothetical protein